VQSPPRALLVDLNNFARYPTLAVGYLIAALRRASVRVDLLSPLSRGLPATERERRETLRDQMQRRAYFSTHPATIGLHDLAYTVRSRKMGRPHPQVLAETRRAIEETSPDILLLSAYVDHYPSVVALASIAARHGVPVLVGGPVFNVPQIAAQWTAIKGVTAVVGGEADLTLADLVTAAINGDDLTRHAGTFLADGRSGPPAPPLQALEKLPLPDFTDFPWHKYPVRIIPTMTGRGCSWGLCTFCGDVRTANGRTFRTRPVDAVLDELEEQATRYRTSDFIFLDIKLNSNLQMWRGLLASFRDRVPGARWIGVVHVQARGENGLSRDELRAAHESGMTRVTFGLESGSQRLNNLMAKGINLDRTSQFIREAYEAGISVRTTAFVGYPGETADDLAAITRFLRDHERYLDRVRLGLFKAIPGTRFHDLYEKAPARYPGLTRFEWDFRYARARYQYEPAKSRPYRKSKTRLLSLVHQINRQPLRGGAEVFDGLM
jgi:anaerobic magnesium-protoporphyrin IX monomethyl ester cyclase